MGNAQWSNSEMTDDAILSRYTNTALHRRKDLIIEADCEAIQSLKLDRAALMSVNIDKMPEPESAQGVKINRVT